MSEDNQDEVLNRAFLPNKVQPVENLDGTHTYTVRLGSEVFDPPIVPTRFEPRFYSARDLGVHPDWCSDGCTASWNLTGFREACAVHDIRYLFGGPSQREAGARLLREQADYEFYRIMIHNADWKPPNQDGVSGKRSFFDRSWRKAWATTMYSAVRAFAPFDDVRGVFGAKRSFRRWEQSFYDKPSPVRYAVAVNLGKIKPGMGGCGDS